MDTNDVNYIFIGFVTRFLPVGLIGLLIAVIFSASMSSTSSELNALASTSVIDIYKRSVHAGGSEQHYLKVSKLMTLLWGVVAIMVAKPRHSPGKFDRGRKCFGIHFLWYHTRCVPRSIFCQIHQGPCRFHCRFDSAGLHYLLLLLYGSRIFVVQFTGPCHHYQHRVIDPMVIQQ
jgi:hypothetical protein